MPESDAPYEVGYGNTSPGTRYLQTGHFSRDPAWDQRRRTIPLVLPLGNLRVMLRARLPGTGMLYVLDEHPNRGSLDPN